MFDWVLLIVTAVELLGSFFIMGGVVISTYQRKYSSDANKRVLSSLSNLLSNSFSNLKELLESLGHDE
ncbi:hypothetical protein BAOM_0470 [Peribacillus asahii]|uniref:Uncharacterized protein n=1 Tax=Peribacillus asahii TaxID=228899 RepID=A0A3Q9RK72_9BACI|nr:hypothetical protein BAOM_0470 [Peribacillus asahii]